MKTLISLFAAMILSCGFCMGQSLKIEGQNEEGEKVVFEVNASGDTVSMTTYDATGVTTMAFPHDASSVDEAEEGERDGYITKMLKDEDIDTKNLILALFALVCVFMVPPILIALIIYFIYKNKKNKYRLAEKLAENGQPIPDDLKAYAPTRELGDRGIHNIFLGAGLFIFLYALLDSFAIACIGLLVLLNGVGQYLISIRHKYDTTNPDNWTRPGASDKAQTKEEDVTEATEIKDYEIKD